MSPKALSVVALSVLAPLVFAQSSSNLLISGAKQTYQHVRSDILKSAEEMPEADYNYQPAASVRTFGQLVAHVADGQYEFCSAVVPGNEKAPDVEKTKKTKAELIAALKTSFSYCDKAYDSTTDGDAAQMVSLFGHQTAKLSVLNFNTVHTAEHYGNMVTYLRMKGLVPPSSKQ